MKRRFCSIGICFILLISQTACWDMKTIQDMNYITAIGFDYQNGRFQVYSQMLDFSSVAKQEGGKSSGPASVWVGQVEGETVSEAFNKLYKTSQQQVFWGHVSAFVFKDEALRHGVGRFVDGITRYNETRFTQWVYSTKEPIDRLFTVTPFFNLSPLASILSHPEENYRQFSFIKPVRLYKVIANLREPGNRLMLPSLAISNEIWKKNNKPDPKLEVSGVHALNDEDELEWFPDDQLKGLRWLQEKTSRTPLVVFVNGKRAGSVSIHKPEVNVIPLVRDDKVGFDIRMKCKVTVTEFLIEMDDETLKKQVEKEIAEQIKQTFEIGMEHDVDLYQLEHIVYRKSFADWSRLTGNGAKPLKAVQINNVKIDVDIEHSGMFEMHKKHKEY
ncbi:Ger(x)C family spore germination protein [Paenibacillus sedimenti]|uniref:Ger(X)C family spore germination protein n=1 Tax=Paenibacillus sedimenti TaxID=2770274 RepID=A0A926KNU9_9BACL|nr:Ger(x)C family spore germination protein [Paenibacillus sedimenti]MBD0379544.1 Ger(x)C family spore germination protein [Paenibacillus sedimenti]